MLVLEEMEHARSRGANIVAEVGAYPRFPFGSGSWERKKQNSSMCTSIGLTRATCWEVSTLFLAVSAWGAPMLLVFVATHPLLSQPRYG